MRYLEIEKQANGSYRARFVEHANGSLTEVNYATAEEAAKALAVLGVAIPDFGVEADRAIIYFKEDGNVDHSQFDLISTNEDDAGKSIKKVQKDFPDITLTTLSSLKTDLKAKAAQDAQADSADLGGGVSLPAKP